MDWYDARTRGVGVGAVFRKPVVAINRLSITPIGNVAVPKIAPRILGHRFNGDGTRPELVAVDLKRKRKTG